MIPKCPLIRAEPTHPVSQDPCLGLAIRDGSYRRSSDSRWIPRFKCRRCRRGFSQATLSPCFGQKRRRLNIEIERLYNSGLSQRRLAFVLKANRKTVVRKMRFLARQARIEQAAFIKETYADSPSTRLKEVQFDDLETSEHTKCKPLSVALAVDPKTRRVLSFQVSQMPPKGLLKAPALKKYGPRKDERAQGWRRLMRELAPLVAENATFTSDEIPHYPKYLKEQFPKARHERLKSRRGCIAGQGELKKIGFDPLFALNHTCAMLRANMNRLFRRTWCTTKNREALLDHLAIYVNFHNRVLTSVPAG
jgi:hypothetical protein